MAFLLFLFLGFSSLALFGFAKFVDFYAWLAGPQEPGPTFSEICHLAHKERVALEQARYLAMDQLRWADQVWLRFSPNVPFTQAKAARRRFWKVMDPAPYACLFDAQLQGYVDREVLMQREGMPAYFRKKVHALCMYKGR